MQILTATKEEVTKVLTVKVSSVQHAKVTKSRETRFHSRKLGFTPDKLGLSRVN